MGTTLAGRGRQRRETVSSGGRALAAARVLENPSRPIVLVQSRSRSALPLRCALPTAHTAYSVSAVRSRGRARARPRPAQPHTSHNDPHNVDTTHNARKEVYFVASGVF